MLWPVRLNFRGLDDSAAEEGRTVAGAGDSTGVDGRDEERSFRAIAARKRARIGAAPKRHQISTAPNTQLLQAQKVTEMLTRKKKPRANSERARRCRVEWWPARAL